MAEKSKKEYKTIEINGTKVRLFRYEGDSGWQKEA